MTEQLRIL